MKNKIFYCVVVFILLSGFVLNAIPDDTFAGELVDIDVANQRIAQVQENIKAYEEEKANLEKENEGVNKEIDALENKLEKLNALIGKLTIKGSQFKDYSDFVVDKEGHEKADKAYLEYRDTLEKLTDKKFEIENTVTIKYDQVTSNKERILALGYKIKNSHDKIAEIEEQIEFTQAKIKDIDSDIDDFNSLLDEAADFIEVKTETPEE